ncbi:uncharacterized protein LOC114315305 [Camellia sinensis]|uniref:uncharacterized protein LOC114315305 n=1 Tax=Camellia sinensis TaxID=4442 RepID=UPI00103614AC|nr:uncharacterized protein LOC114315305 [Camellia sinensis]
MRLRGGRSLKVLRIKKVLPDVIDPVQSAIVQGRRISDNIFLSQELMRGYHRGSGSPRCAMKVDIMKAYDNVRWDFIFDTLAGMGFPSRMIGWIRACITSLSFSICINGELCGYFRGARGLRQGDPISPYLFVIVMEVLARELAKKAESPNFKFHWRGDINSVSLIKEALDEFQGLSGLSPSPLKSHMFFAGMDCHLRGELLSIMDFKEGNLLVYWASLFILPKKVVTEIESCLRAFFWNGPDLKKSGAKVAWVHLCVPRNEGGLGFKSIEVWNKAVIAKHVWFLFSGGEQSMWCQWVKSYLLKGRSFWCLKVPSDPSWVWRKLLDLRSIIAPLIKYNVGNGKATFLWFDNWLPLGPLFNRFGDRVISNSGIQKFAKVEAVIYGSRWKWPVCRTWELNEIKAAVPADMKPSLVNDKVVWLPSSDGHFSIKSSWDEWRTHGSRVVWAKILWFKFHIPSTVVWVAIHNRLNTLDRLVVFGTSNSSICCLCGVGLENHNHLFFKCPFSYKVWNGMQATVDAGRSTGFLDASSMQFVTRRKVKTSLSESHQPKFLGSVIDPLLVVTDPLPVVTDQPPTVTDQPPVVIVNMLLTLQQSMDVITNKFVTNREAFAELHCPFEVSTSHPPLMVHLDLEPPPPIEELHEPNLQ